MGKPRFYDQRWEAWKAFVEWYNLLPQKQRPWPGVSKAVSLWKSKSQLPHANTMADIFERTGYGTLGLVVTVN